MNSSLDDTDCNLTWTDPMHEILEGIRALTFRTAIAASNSTTTSQTTTARIQREENRYQSSYAFLILALIMPLSSVAFIAALLVGWRDLGRTVSLSPIETAKAFDAPILAQAGSNAFVDELVKELGERNLKYGESLVGEKSDTVSEEENEWRLIMGDPETVIRPEAGRIYL
jgi:hypothetical protein